ncbi:M48 family metalloprotease [Francisellaceae bacterium]|nr:M48 family metalloprotease [Francisellaceae bacterium]
MRRPPFSLCATLFFIFLLFPPAYSKSLSPHLGDASNNKIPTAEAKLLGQQVLAKISKQTPLIDDPILNDYINNLGHTLLSYSEFPTTNIRFVILKSDQINAFALPGNIIGFNSELILRAQSEGELAGVLAHEISHITQNHFYRMLEYQQHAYLGNILTLLAAALAASAQPQGAQAILTAGIGAQQQKMIGHVREHEYEADRIGTKVLTQAGYPAKAMADFFTRLPQGTYHNAVFESIMTHPLPSKRYGEALNRQTQTKRFTAEQKLNFKFIQVRLKALTSRNPPKLLAETTHLPKTDFQQPQNKYLMALLYQKTNAKNLALAAIEKLYQNHPESLVIAATYLEFLLHDKKLLDLQKNLKTIEPIFSYAYPILLIQAKLKLTLKQPKKSEVILKDIIEFYPNQPQAYELLSRIQKKQNDIGLAHYYMGEFYLLKGRLHEALVQFQLSIKDTPTDNYLYKKSVQKRDLLKEHVF